MSLVRYEWNLLGPTDSRPVALLPRVEVMEETDRYVLRADLPGVAPQDTEITVEQGVLTLQAQRPAQHPQTTATRFQRRFALPEDADAEQIAARSTHGVLEIGIAKLAKAQPRRITVEAACGMMGVGGRMAHPPCDGPDPGRPGCPPARDSLQ
jgi:HSP20 family protein